MSSCERGKQALVKTPWTRIKIKAKDKVSSPPASRPRKLLWISAPSEEHSTLHNPRGSYKLST